MNPAPIEAVEQLKITTDRSVDTTSIEAIVRDATRGLSADEEKVLAVYHWCRRMMYHHRCACADRDRRDVLKAVNSFGFNLCGSQTAVFVTILQKAGFKTRVIMGQADGDFGGHTFCEVFFDGRWHCFDPMTSFFVYTRGDSRHIASIDELKADPSLVTRARAEGRAPPGFIYCMGHQELSAADKPRLAGIVGDEDLTWSTLLFAAGSIADFWTLAPSAVRTLDDVGTYGGRCVPGSADVSLHLNEVLARNWDNEGCWIKAASHRGHGPHHVCGDADEHDPVNFRFFEPYLKKNFGLTSRCYRYYGNGRQDWKPEDGGIPHADWTAVNLLVSGGMHEAAVAGKPASLTIPRRSAYAVARVEVELEVRQPAGARIMISARDLQRPDAPAVQIGVIDGARAGELCAVAAEMDSPLFAYEINIAADGGPVRFRVARLKTVFMLNWAALPSLYPGDNTIVISAAAPTRLDGARLRVTYAWDDGPGWKDSHTDTQIVKELPHAYRLYANVPSDKMPRMRRLEMALEPE